MKFTHTLAILAVVVSLSACTPPIKPQKPVEQPAAVSCVSKLERSLDFTYEPSKAIKWVSEDYKVAVYMITTTDDKQIILNSLELENYNCK